MNRKKNNYFFLLSVLLLAVGINSYGAINPSMNLCVKAISSGQSYIEAREQIALQRKATGSLSETGYLAELQTLANHSQWLTLDTCMASIGDQVNIFQCLVDNEGNMKTCNE